MITTRRPVNPAHVALGSTTALTTRDTEETLCTLHCQTQEGTNIQLRPRYLFLIGDRRVHRLRMHMYLEQSQIQIPSCLQIWRLPHIHRQWVPQERCCLGAAHNHPSPRSLSALRAAVRSLKKTTRKRKGRGERRTSLSACKTLSTKASSNPAISGRRASDARSVYPKHCLIA